MKISIYATNRTPDSVTKKLNTTMPAKLPSATVAPKSTCLNNKKPTPYVPKEHD